MILLQGNFETKAQSLAMRLAERGCWRPSYSQSIISNDTQVYIIYIKESYISKTFQKTNPPPQSNST